MGTRIYLYPGWLRFWHAINALMCLVLIVSGLSMQYTDFERYILDFQLAVQLHNIAGVILSFNYFIFLFGNLFTPNGRQYFLFRRGVLKNLFTQLHYYTLGIFRKEATPFPITTENKFNPIQRTAYVLVGYVATIIVIVTGWAYLFPEIVPNTIGNVSGLLINDLIHISMGYFISIFLIIHIYFITIGNSKMKNFKSMVTGWHE